MIRFSAVISLAGASACSADDDLTCSEAIAMLEACESDPDPTVCDDDSPAAVRVQSDGCDAGNGKADWFGNRAEGSECNWNWQCRNDDGLSCTDGLCSRPVLLADYCVGRYQSTGKGLQEWTVIDCADGVRAVSDAGTFTGGDAEVGAADAMMESHGYRHVADYPSKKVGPKWLYQKDSITTPASDLCLALNLEGPGTPSSASLDGNYEYACSEDGSIVSFQGDRAAFLDHMAAQGYGELFSFGDVSAPSTYVLLMRQ